MNKRSGLHNIFFCMALLLCLAEKTQWIILEACKYSFKSLLFRIKYSKLSFNKFDIGNYYKSIIRLLKIDLFKKIIYTYKTRLFFHLKSLFSFNTVYFGYIHYIMIISMSIYTHTHIYYMHMYIFPYLINISIPY